jgi:hypothetical membrane protein
VIPSGPKYPSGKEYERISKGKIIYHPAQMWPIEGGTTLASKLRNSNLAGALLFVGGLQWFMTVMAAETLFPGYSTRANDLSDLASTIPPNLLPVQPSAIMFNATTFLLGLMIIISAFVIYRANGERLFSLLFALFGAAAMSVGIFPGDAGIIHGLVALVTFVASSLSAMAAYRLERRSFACISAVIGILSLTVLFSAFFLGETSPFWLAFGRGGEERLIAYPVVLWVTGFGGYLMGAASTNNCLCKCTKPQD